MNPTDIKLEEVLSGVDDDLAPNPAPEGTPDGSNDGTPNPETPPEDPTPPPAADDKGDDTGTPPAGDDSGTPDDDKDNKGFTADEVAADDTPPDEAKPDPEKKDDQPPVPTKLDPETQYIVDNLPEITTRIKVGEEIKEISVKSFTQLPQDVEFASKNDELAFLNAMTAQENRAQSLQQTFRNDQTSKQTSDFEQKENASIRQDITSLQGEGKLPKFQVKPDSPEFEKDPATQTVQKVIDFMNARNQKYLEAFNNGSAYKHIGFEEAFYMMPDTQKAAAEKAAQTAEDTERHNKADRVGAPSGLSNVNIKKPTVSQGTTLDQIVERVDQTW